MKPADSGTDDPLCGKCSLSVRSGRGHRYYCRSCGEFFHRACWETRPYHHCPKCGGLSARVIPSPKKITPALISELERERAETKLIRFARDDGSLEPGGVVPEELTDEAEYARIGRHVSLRRKLWFAGGILATGVVALCLFALVSLNGTRTASGAAFVVLLSATALAGAAAGLIAAKECFGRVFSRTGRLTPVELTKRYYETALSVEINPNRLLHMLHPAAVVRLGRRPEKLLEDRWHDIRKECREMITHQPAYSNARVIRVDESPDSDASEKDVEAVVAFSCRRVNRKYGPTRLIGRRLLTLRNRAVKTESGWLLRRPFPADPFPVEASEAACPEDDESLPG